MLVELTIGQAIKRARKSKGISGKALAEKMGYHPNNVSKWETDQSYPRITTIIDMADVLGISIDELVGHEVKGGDK